MNELVKKQDLETALQEEIASGGGFGPLLKFDANTSKYTIDKNEVPVGRKFIVHIPQYAARVGTVSGQASDRVQDPQNHGG